MANTFFGYNTDQYLNANPDVKSSGMSAYDHFQRYGKDEGRTFGNLPDNFNATDYLSANPDIAKDPYYANNPGEHYSVYGRDEGRSLAPTTKTVTMPSMSNTNIPGWIDELSTSIPNYNDAYASFKDLPNKIDEWTGNAIKRQRVTGDLASDVFNKAGNQRAGSGIMGGTENQNLKANIMSNVIKTLNDNKTNIEMAGNNLKAQSISALPGSALSGVSAMNNLYSTNTADQQFWANQAAQMLMSGY